MQRLTVRTGTLHRGVPVARPAKLYRRLGRSDRRFGPTLYPERIVQAPASGLGTLGRPWPVPLPETTPARVRWATWRRFDPSSSPSATRPSVQTSASKNRPKNPEQKWGFRGLWLYWRSAIFGTIGLEKALFSKASYCVGLVRLRKMKRQRYNWKSKSASVRVSIG